MGFLDDIDIKQFYEHLDFIRGNYSGVERLDELLDLVLSFKEGNEDFIRFGKMDGFKGSKIFHHKKNLKPFKVMVRKGLGNDYRLPLYIPKITRRVITGNAFVGVDSACGLSDLDPLPLRQCFCTAHPGNLCFFLIFRN